MTGFPADFAVQRLAFTALLRRKAFQYNKRTCLHVQTEEVWLANTSVHHSDFVSYSTDPPFMLYLICDSMHLPGPACFSKARVVDLTMSESSLRYDLLHRVAESQDKTLQRRWQTFQVGFVGNTSKIQLVSRHVCLCKMLKHTRGSIRKHVSTYILTC